MEERIRTKEDLLKELKSRKEVGRAMMEYAAKNAEVCFYPEVLRVFLHAGEAGGEVGKLIRSGVNRGWLGPEEASKLSMEYDVAVEEKLVEIPEILRKKCKCNSKD